MNVKFFSSVLCGYFCQENTGCTHFEWVNSYNTVECVLKKGMVSKNNAIANKKNYTGCGIIEVPGI